MNTSVKHIPYVAIDRQHQLIKAELMEAVGDVIESGQFILGKCVSEFEQHMASLSGARFAIGVSSGTDALVLALKALGVGPEDEVITVPNTFVSTVSSIVLAGAKPRLVDVRDDFNMDPDKLKEAVTERTKAIIPVHLTGRPADMQPIMEIAQKYNLYVVEDCAQAVMAEYRGKRVGSFGNVGCFSLHPLKTLNACGDGGVITTDDEALDTQFRMLRNIGLRTRDDCVVWSGNLRLDNLHAAILLVKIKYLEIWTEKRRSNADFYREGLKDIPYIRLPLDQPFEKAVYHTFIIQANRRDELKAYLADNGIGTAVHYPVPVHLQTVGRGLGYSNGSFPVAEQQACRILSLPIYPELKQDDLAYIIEKIRRFYGV